MAEAAAVAVLCSVTWQADTLAGDCVAFRVQGCQFMCRTINTQCSSECTGCATKAAAGLTRLVPQPH